MKRFIMFTVLTLLVTCLLVAPALAASVTVSWNETTQYCSLDNAGDVAGYIVKWGVTAGGPYPNEVTVNGATTLTVDIDVGVQSNTVVYFHVVAFDSAGIRSDDAGGCSTSASEVSKVFPPQILLDPTGVAAQ